MKKINLFILLLISIFVFAGEKMAVALTPEQIPDGSYVIGEYLYMDLDSFLSELPSEVQTKINENINNSVYDGQTLTGKHAMLGATSIDSDLMSKMIIYSKGYFDETWTNAFDYSIISGNDLPDVFNITHVNGICVLPQGCGSGTRELYVTFHMPGDSIENPDTVEVPVTYGSSVKASQVPDTPNVTGKKFKCWAFDTGNNQRVCYEFGEVTANVDLYPEFDVINYKLIYHKNDGTTIKNVICNVGNIETINECKFDLGTSQPNTPNGYNFLGWSTSPKDSNHAYNAGDSLLPVMAGAEDVNVDLYPVYVKQEYTVDYVLNGGSYQGVLTTQFDITNGNPTFDFKPVKEGYTVDQVVVNGGTYNRDNNKITISYPNLTGHIVTVSWKDIKYDVVRGDTNMPIKSDCEYSVPCSLPSATAPTGKEFVGWSKNNNPNDLDNLYVGEVIKLTTEDNSTVVVYPKFRNKTYSISYDLKEGNLDSGSIGDLIVSYDLNNKQVNLPQLKRVGYEFKGWRANYLRPNESNINSGSYNINTDRSLNENNGNVVFTAQFTPVSYTINYYTGGNQITPKTYSSADAYSIELDYTPASSQKFVGWTTDRDNPIYAFKKNSSITRTEMAMFAGNGSTVNLYPYTINDADKVVTISYDANGGKIPNFSDLNTKFVKGQSITLPTLETRAGYDSYAWKIGNNTYAGGASYTINSDTKAVAEWTGHTYSIKLHDNDEHVCQFQYVYGSGNINLEDKARSCSNFNTNDLAGWALSNGGNLFYGIGVEFNNVLSDKDYYAVYEEDGYLVTFYDGTTEVGQALVDPGYRVNSGDEHVAWIHELENGYQSAQWVYGNGYQYTLSDVINDEIDVYLYEEPDNTYSVSFYDGTNKIGEANVAENHTLSEGPAFVEWVDVSNNGFSGKSIWLGGSSTKSGSDSNELPAQYEDIPWVVANTENEFTWEDPVNSNMNLVAYPTHTNWFVVTFHNEDEVIGVALVMPGKTMNGVFDDDWMWEPGSPQLPSGYGSNSGWSYSNRDAFTWDTPIYKETDVYLNSSLGPVADRYVVNFYKGFVNPKKIGEAVVDANHKLNDGSPVVSWNKSLPTGYGSSKTWHTTKANNDSNVFDWNSRINFEMNLYTN